jgi:hypothetical protein
MDFATTASVDQRTANQIKLALDQFPLAVQDSVVRSAMRPFLRKEMQLIRAANGAKLPKKDLKAKIKVFNSGVCWGATAYRTGKAKTGTGEIGGRNLRAAYDAAGTGWRSHFTELGTHTWSSTLRTPPSARGLGWKRGLYHRGRGKYLRGTHASELTHRAMSSQFQTMLVNALNLAIDKRNYSMGRVQRFKKVEEFS